VAAGSLPVEQRRLEVVGRNVAWYARAVKKIHQNFGRISQNEWFLVTSEKI
jgi:hypothetical protein